MVEEGVADDVSSVFALHLWPGLPFGTAATKAGPIMAAADAFEMTVRGAGGHGAMPHLTADAIAMAAHIDGVADPGLQGGRPGRGPRC